MFSLRKTIISFAVLGIGFAAIGGLGMYPLWKGIVKDSEKLISEKRDFVRLNTDLENIRNFEKITGTYQAQLADLDRLFIASDTPIEFIEFLERIAQDLGFALTIDPKSPTQDKSDGWPSILFNVSASGSYANFLTLLKKLENSPHLVEIKGVTIKSKDIFAVKNDGEPFSYIADFSISMKVYTQ